MLADIDSQRPKASKAIATLCGTLSGVVVVMIALWVLQDPVENLRTDWTAFDNAADRLFNGETIYRPIDVDEEPLPYLYPPHALVLALPLALFGFLGSWALSAMLTFSAFLAGLLLAQRGMQAGERGTGLVMALSTGTMLATVLIAQYSGLYVFAFGLALWLWVTDRQALAGLALAILLVKPNIAIAIPVVLIWSRSWRVFGGFLAGALLSLALSFAVGFSRWGEFFTSVQNQTSLQRDNVVPVDKMVTFVGGFQSVFGLDALAPVTVAVWLVTTLIVGLATLSVWSAARIERDLSTALGVLAIFVVVANPRLYFYDAALVVFGVFVLWHQRHRFGVALRRWFPVLALALWVASWGSIVSGLNALIAPLGALIVVAVARDVRLRSDGNQKPSDFEIVDFSVNQGEGGRRAA